MSTVSRREFLQSCSAHLAAAAAFAPFARRIAWAQEARGTVIAREPFGYLEHITGGVAALVSTPLQGNRTTLCNGGIIAGRSGVLAIEGFYEAKGATWLATRTRELAGRWPTHVVLTHFHSDHTNGLAGYLGDAEAPTLRSTSATRELVLQKNKPSDAALLEALKKIVVLPASEPVTIDLGGRTVRIVPRSGHTPSDVSIEVADPPIVFCGDLVWNAMFPNYVDALPIELGKSVRALRRADPATVYVPGHGAIARAPEFDRYVSVLDEVEGAARRAHAQGVSAAEAAAKFTLPSALGEWALFNPAFFERAFSAWYRQLAQGE
jgi:glyoxylase-like metal-dependent hydrolase (beta-lactamase superfamily II)